MLKVLGDLTSAHSSPSRPCRLCILGESCYPWPRQVFLPGSSPQGPTGQSTGFPVIQRWKGGSKETGGEGGALRGLGLVAGITGGEASPPLLPFRLYGHIRGFPSPAMSC